jgi:hypothetical protein
METPDRFKNSPIHDKSAILELMDELKPEQMAELVGYLQNQVKLLSQPHVSGELPISCVNEFEKPEYCSQRNNHLCQKCKDW